MPLIWECSNERLSTIIVGLEPNGEDTILAICGSGDQAFALSEYAHRVVAVDTDPDQLARAVQRAQHLRTGDFDRFLTIDKRGSYGGNGSSVVDNRILPLRE